MNFEQPPKPAENTEEKKEKLGKPTILETIRKKTGKIARGLAVVGALATTEPGDMEEIKPQEHSVGIKSIYDIQKTEPKLSKIEYESLVEALMGDDFEKALATSNLYESEPWLSEVLIRVAEKHPVETLQYANRFKDAEGANLVIETAVKNISSWEKKHTLIQNINSWINLPFADEIIEKMFSEEGESGFDIYTVLESSGSFSQSQKGRDLFKRILENKVSRYEYFTIATHPESLPDEDWAEKILIKAAEEAPETFLDHGRKLDGKRYERIITKIVNERPDLAATRIPEIISSDGVISGKFDEFLKNSDDPICNAIYQIRTSINTGSTRFFTSGKGVEFRERISVLAELVASKKNNIDEIIEIAKDEEKIRNTIFSLLKEPGLKYREVAERELSEIVLIDVEQINRLHEAPDQERFSIVENSSAEQIYILMVHGEEEVFTSTFNGLFNRTIEKLEKENISGSQLLEQTGFVKFRTFIRLCTEFNRLDDFLKTIPENEQEKILRKFVSDLETAKDPLREAVSIAEAINSIDNSKIIGILEDEVKTQIKSTSEKTTILYKLIASTFNEKGSDEEWLKEIEKDYKLPSLNTVETKDLFNKNNTNIQQYFFYNDEDGIASFKNFVDQYKGKQNWSVKDRGTFVTIESEENGRHLKIYANKPENENDGPEEIAKELEKSEIKTIVVVHRGHSYHANKTISRIPKIAKIVSLGSCGGYRNLSEVLTRAPEAHIISTKGTGTKWVNDPLFKMLNQEILSGHNIKWSEFWDKAQQELGDQEKFKDYVPPHKNFGAMFIKAYEKATSETSN